MANFQNIFYKTRKTKAIELAAGILVVIALIYYDTELRTVAKLTLGLVVSLAISIPNDASLLRDKLQEATSALREFTRLAASPLPRDRDIFNLAVRYSGRKIPAPEMTQVWRDLSWIFQDRYDCTNYIKPSDIYNETWAAPAIAIQVAKMLAAHPTQIRKVFLLDDLSEIEPVRNNLNNQRSVGIEIRHLLYNKIAKNVALSGPATALKSTDFGIFDNRCILIWNLDAQREIIDGELVFERNEVEKYQSFFDQLFGASTTSA